ncbi:MAG TPA: ABC transporter substrate-binding protein [Acidimicrobiales bacterium]|nr:ABC transporter substrate-binding protein [Acidimicrobiales bacterium]
MSRQLSHLPVIRALRGSGSGDPTGRRIAAVAIPLAVLVLMIGLVLVTGGAPVDRGREPAGGQRRPANEFGEQLEVGQAPIGEAGEPLPPGSSGAPATSRRPGSLSSGTTIPAPNPSARLPGVNGKEIVVAYYWKGDRTRTSPYLAGSGVDTNLDEGQSFTTLIEYINRHADGGATLMGFPFDLHGHRLKGVVLEAGNSPEEYAAVGRRLVEEVKPAVAISAHGSLSAYVCPQLAAAGIHNLSTFDVAPGLVKRTGGYCLPLGASWERQTQVTTSYLATRMSPVPYTGPEGNGPRRFGVVWGEHPGLVDSAPRFVDGLRRAGVNVAETATMSPDLTEAQQQAGNVVARMRAAGVNTMVFPEGGAPLSFTQAAEAQQYRPDYYVWPCSGQDTTAMVRLFNAAQWDRAQGLSCYDSDFQTDLANDERTQRTEWYRQYREVSGDDPPANTGLVYQSLLPLLAALTNSGGELTVGAFRDGLDDFDSYRYSGIDGRTDNSRRMLLDFDEPDRSMVGDFTEIAWSSGRVAEGSRVPGSYEYPDDEKRYPASHRW